MQDENKVAQRMYLSELNLWNFRQFGSGTTAKGEVSNPSLHVEFNPGMNVLIGRNDSGKTAIVDAIKYVLKTHSYEKIWVGQEDFFGAQNWLKIEIILRGFSDEEASDFAKQIEWEGSGETQTPFLRLVYELTKNSEGKVSPSDVQAGSGTTLHSLDAGAREKLKVTYLKPLRDAGSELVPKRGSRLSRILLGHEAFKGREQDHPLLLNIDQFRSAIENYFRGTDNAGASIDDGKGKALKDEIDNLVREFYDSDKQSRFSVLETHLHQLLEKLSLSLDGELNPGLGTLNRLFIASELLHLEKRDWTGLRLGLVEELEAHLHPQAQMKIVSSLQKKKNVQTILTTHSPLLGSKIALENLILCDGNSAFSLSNKMTKLAPSDYKFLEWFLDSTKANLFFAFGVIIVEGISEELLIPAIAKHMKATKKIKGDLTDSGVSIVNVGNTGFLHYSRIFLRSQDDLVIDIPVAVITDSDVRHYIKQPKQDENGEFLRDEKNKQIHQYVCRNTSAVESETNQKINALEAEHNAQNVKTFAAREWTLEFCLWKSKSFGAFFQEAAMEVHPQMTESNFEQELAEKLIKKTLDKAKIAYALASRILEDAESESPKLTLGAENSEEERDSANFLLNAIRYACRD